MTKPYSDPFLAFVEGLYAASVAHPELSLAQVLWKAWLQYTLVAPHLSYELPGFVRAADHDLTEALKYLAGGDMK